MPRNFYSHVLRGLRSKRVLYLPWTPSRLDKAVSKKPDMSADTPVRGQGCPQTGVSADRGATISKSTLILCSFPSLPDGWKLKENIFTPQEINTR